MEEEKTTDVKENLVNFAVKNIYGDLAQRKKLIKDRPDLKDLIDSYTVFSTSKSYKISKRKEKKEDKKKKAS